MSFRIHSQLPELKRELENKLLELQGQLDGDFDYEISAEVLPREQAVEASQQLAAKSGADTIFLAAGAFVAEQSVTAPVDKTVDEDPDFAMGLAPVPDPTLAAENDRPTQTISPAESGCATPSKPRINTAEIQQALAEQSARAREFSDQVAGRTASFITLAGRSSSKALDRASEWASKKRAAARAAGSELRKRIAEKREQSRARAAEWNARRSERQAAESKQRAARERAAHREAELAAAAAHIMRREQEKNAGQPVIHEQARIVRNAKPMIVRERDTWPIWRNAFVVAACLALIGVFLLTAGGKQTKASPATSTELNQPAVAAPEHLVPQPKEIVKPPAAKPAAAAKSAKALKSSPPHQRIARAADDDLQEVTVRHYPNASPIAPPKKNAKGVVQISDME
jgi:hypothetical protein